MFTLLIAAVALGALVVGGHAQMLRKQRAWVHLGAIAIGTGLVAFLYVVQLDESPLGATRHFLLGFIGISALLLAAALPSGGNDSQNRAPHIIPTSRSQPESGVESDRM